MQGDMLTKVNSHEVSLKNIETQLDQIARQLLSQQQPQPAVMNTKETVQGITLRSETRLQDVQQQQCETKQMNNPKWDTGR